jgi:hypothetical protein
MREKENKKENYERGRGQVRESKIKRIKNNKWEMERESEKEGDFFYKMEEGEGE